MLKTFTKIIYRKKQIKQKVYFLKTLIHDYYILFIWIQHIQGALLKSLKTKSLQDKKAIF